MTKFNMLDVLLIWLVLVGFVGTLYLLCRLFCALFNIPWPA